MKRKKCPKTTCKDIEKLLPEMWRLAELTRKEGKERGFFAYQDPRNCALKIIESCKGTNCKLLPETPIEFFSGYALLFHTHPYSGAWPSPIDLIGQGLMKRASGKKAIHCIGDATPSGKSTIRCWRADERISQLIEASKSPVLLPDWSRRYAMWLLAGENAWFVLTKTGREKLERIHSDYMSGEVKPECVF